MERDTDFQGEPSDTHDRIMRATYAAVARYGYAGVSIQRIADEASLSKGAFYNHYDGKEELLLAFLDFMIERYRSEFDRAMTGDPMADLSALLTHAITGELPAGTLETDRPVAPASGPLVDLRAQAVHDESFRERFSRLDDRVAADVAALIRSGIDRGVFREVDPEGAAEVLLTLVMGSTLRRSTVRAFDADRLRTEVDRVLRAYLVSDGSTSESLDGP
jgi:AcrR family transcriptional regulator